MNTLHIFAINSPFRQYVERRNMNYLLFFVFHGHLEPGQRVPRSVLVTLFAQHRLDFLSSSAEVHQLTSEYHALVNQSQIFVLQTTSNKQELTNIIYTNEYNMLSNDELLYRIHYTLNSFYLSMFVISVEIYIIVSLKKTLGIDGLSNQ